MKILLDENIPVQLKKILSSTYKWYTVRELGWQGTKNGLLLKRMVESGFAGLKLITLKIQGTFEIII